MFPMLLIAAAAAPVAAEPLTLQTRILAEKRVAAPDGTTRVTLAPATRAGPGDAVVVEVRYRNTGRQPLGGVVIANPVPPGLAYRSARTGPAPELSVDGRGFGPLASLRVGGRAATLSDVTHVRWRLSDPVTAGGGGEFAFQAVVR